MAPESRDEVRQRIASLYDQAENATGNFNATRAMAGRSRSRSRSGGVPLAKRAGRRPDPELDQVARQWFDDARARLGPTVAAVLPADRLPGGPAAPVRAGREWTGGTSGGERELRALPAGGEALALPGGDREVRALPAGERPAPGNGGPPERRPEALELERGAARAVAELTAGPPTAAPAGRPPQSPETSLPAVRSLELAGPALALTAGTTAEPGGGWTAPVPAAPAAAQGAAVQGTLPGAAVPGRTSPAASKAGNRRKLATARDLLSRHTGQLALPGTAAQPAWATEPRQPPHPAPAEAAQQWQESQWAAPGQPATPAPALDSGSLTTLTDTGSFTSLTDTGSFTPPTDTGSFTPPTDTGSFTPPTDTGSLVPVTGAGPLPPLTDTGAFATPLTTTGSLLLPPPAVESPGALRAAKAIAFARAQIGKPCVWGATGPDSYDCSSLTQAAWRAAGVSLPRAAYEQALAGTPVTLAGMEPGDLVLFFDDDRHVGLHVGDGMMVHAPGPGSSIREESVYGAGEAAIHRIVRPA